MPNDILQLWKEDPVITVLLHCPTHNIGRLMPATFPIHPETIQLNPNAPQVRRQYTISKAAADKARCNFACDLIAPRKLNPCR